MSKYYTADHWIALLQQLAHQGQDFLTLSALQRLSGLREGATRKAMLRLEKKGYVTRVGRNLYANRLGHPTLEELAMILSPPCYISFESALERLWYPLPTPTGAHLCLHVTVRTMPDPVG